MKTINGRTHPHLIRKGKPCLNEVWVQLRFTFNEVELAVLNKNAEGANETKTEYIESTITDLVEMLSDPLDVDYPPLPLPEFYI